MKQKERNQRMRRCILDGALTEFAVHGYAASSINTICATQKISKGILYHYFTGKDALYLACVEECFQTLTRWLRNGMEATHGTLEEQLEAYFMFRSAFFAEHPRYQPLFCEAVISPPAHLKSGVDAIKAEFNTFNTQTLSRLLESVRLRPHITKAEVIETFRQFQDFFNAQYSMEDVGEEGFAARELDCHKVLNILLYGVIDQKGGTTVQ